MNKIGAYNFNFDWHFHNGDVDNQNYGGINGGAFNRPQWQKAGNEAVSITGYPDEKWETIKVPHDYAIEKCDFTDKLPSLIGSLAGQIGWYRKEFILPKEAKGQRIFLRCDGVYRDSQVWCNGHFMGRHLGGYMGFTYELTEVLMEEEINTIAVRVDATECEGWWYTGAGILRDVWLVAQPKLCIKDHGVYFKTTNVDMDSKVCDLETIIDLTNGNLTNENALVKVEIYDVEQLIISKEISTDIEALENKKISIKSVIEDMIPWDLENRHLYSGKVYVNGVLCYEDSFGPRKINYNVKDGLFLNDKTLFLKGACGHDDFAGVGGALPKAIIRYKVEKLMEIGCNAYRCSHNPPPAEFLEVCDEVGMLVVDETRLPGTSYEMEEDFVELIKRDRNHPSVIFWSMGNEEMNIQGKLSGVNIFNKMKVLGERYDNTREYLFAINCLYNELLNFQCENGLNLPINGVNYQLLRNHDAFKVIHKDHPDMCFINTETTGMCCVRGYKLFDKPNYNTNPMNESIQIWTNPKFDHNFTCYGDFHPKWGLQPEEVLKDYVGQTHMLGMFLWTGFDYRGETFPFYYPQTVSSYGVIDLCGFMKDWAYYLKAQWTNEKFIHLLPSWNLPEEEGEIVDVWAFSNYNDGELFLNGRSLGRKQKEDLDKFEWKVPYEKGTLRVVAYENDKIVCEDVKITSKKAAKLVFDTTKTSLMADGDDISVVNVSAIDEDGNFVSDSDVEVEFRVEGTGIIKGVGNGKPDSVEHDKKPVRTLYAGKACVLVESTFEEGEILVTACALGLEPAVITLKTLKADMKKAIFGTYKERELNKETDEWA